MRLILHRILTYSLFVCLSLSFLQAQIPTRPNAYNTNGERTGEWIILYDSAYQNVVNNISEANYYCLMELREGKPVGGLECFYISGIKQWDGRLLSLEPEIKHGQIIFYHPNGIIKEKAVYRNDTVQGIMTSYHDNGLLESQGEMKDGKRTGYWEYFHDNGVLYTQGTFENGKESGYWEMYHPNGNLKVKGNWKDGVQEGHAEYYYSSGQLQSAGMLKEGNLEGKWRFYYDNGEIEQIAEYQENVNHGSLVAYHLNGNLSKTGTFKNGKENGEFAFYNEDESVQSKGRILEGMYEGDWVFYFPDGKVKSEGPYKESLTNGYWKYYQESGFLDSECNITMGKWDGVAKFYHLNGELKSIGEYRNDLKQGQWKYFNDSGTFTGISTYVDEVLHGHFEYHNQDGILLQKGTLSHDKKEGEWIFYHPNGQLSHQGVFKNDFENDYFIHYYPNGNKSKEGAFINGLYEGHRKYYFENGYIKSEGLYLDGKKVGHWKYYNDSGQVIAEGEYRNGESVGVWKYYYDNGVLKKEGIEQDDKENGKWIYYDIKGRKESEGNWEYGKKQEQWIFYDSLGTISQTENYHDNKPLNFRTLYDSANAVSKKGNYKLADKIITEAKNYYKKHYSRSDLLYAELYELPANFYYDQKNYPKAIKYYKKSLKHVSTIKPDTSNWHTYYLGRIAISQARSENYEESIANYIHILDLIKSRPGGNTSKAYLDNLALYTDVLRWAGRTGEALEILQHEQDLLVNNPEQKHKKLIASNYLSLIQYTYDLDSTSYVSSAVDSLLSFDERNDLTTHYTYPTALYYKGKLLDDIQDYNSAKPYFEKSVKSFLITGDTSFFQFLSSLMHLGSYYYSTGDYAKSGSYYFEVLKRCQELNMWDDVIYRRAYLAMAKQFWAEGKLEEALSYYRNTIDLEKKATSPNLNQLSQAQLGVAICLEALNNINYDETEIYFNHAITTLDNPEKFNFHYVNANLFYCSFLRTGKVNLDKSNTILHGMLRYNSNHGNPDKGVLAGTYINLGKNFNKIHQFDSALYYFDKAQNLLSDDPSDYISEYSEVVIATGNLYEDKNEYQKAQVYNLKALKAIEEHLGKEHLYYANALVEVAVNFNFQENYPTSILYYRQVLDIKEKLFSSVHNSYLNDLVSLGSVLNNNGQRDESLQILLQAKTSYESKKEEMSSDYLRCLIKLTQTYESKGETDKAEQAVLKSLELANKMYAKNSVKYAESLNDVGSYYSRQQQHDLALYYKKSAVTIIEATYGKVLKYAWYAEGLSSIHFNLGNYTTAVELKEEAVDIYLKQTGESEDYMNALYGLGEIYRSLGQFQHAADTYEQTVEVVKQKYGSYSFAMTNVLEEVGITYWRWKKPQIALNYYQQVKDLFDSLGVYSYNYARLHNLIGLAKFDLGLYAESKSHYEQAIQIADSTTNDDGPSLQYKNNLAFNYLQNEDYEQAEKLWLAGESRYNSKGERDLTRVKWLDNMAALYLAWDKLDKAEKYWTETIDILLTRIKRDFPFLSESGKAAFWDAYKEDFEYFNSYSLKASANGNSTAINQMYDNQLQTKSILLSTSTKERRRILNSGDSTLIKTYLEYVGMKEKLAKYYGYAKDQLTSESIDIVSMEKKTARYEKVLSLDADALKNEEKEKTINWKNIQKTLKTGEAAVEIIRFRYFNKLVTDSVLYAALILTPDTKKHPRLVVLPNGNELESRYIKAYRTSIQYQVEDKTSYPQFWAAIDRELQGINKIFLSPDGAYNQINLGTLLRPDGSYTRDSYDIRLLTSTRDVALVKSASYRKDDRRTGYIFGFPKYDLAHTAIENVLTERGISESNVNERAIDLSKIGFAELPGTKTETEAIAGLLNDRNWETSLFLAGDALEEELKKVANPTLLHIATHGFFLENPTENTRGIELGVNVEKSRTNPLLRSGLLLAGATQTARGKHHQGIENGIFTAYEAMNLDLSGTELVILSACETGRGEIKNGEGVYGLQRAFQIAGADAIIMSLWKVDDSATQLLMTEFYQAWLSGNSKTNALRIAQDKVMAIYPHPYYWGAFILVGS